MDQFDAKTPPVSGSSLGIGKSVAMTLGKRGAG